MAGIKKVAETYDPANNAVIITILFQLRISPDIIASPTKLKMAIERLWRASGIGRPMTDRELQYILHQFERRAPTGLSEVPNIFGGNAKTISRVGAIDSVVQFLKANGVKSRQPAIYSANQEWDYLVKNRKGFLPLTPKELDFIANRVTRTRKQVLSDLLVEMQNKGLKHPVLIRNEITGESQRLVKTGEIDSPITTSEIDELLMLLAPQPMQEEFYKKPKLDRVGKLKTEFGAQKAQTEREFYAELRRLTRENPGVSFTKTPVQQAEILLFDTNTPLAIFNRDAPPIMDLFSIKKFTLGYRKSLNFSRLPDTVSFSLLQKHSGLSFMQLFGVCSFLQSVNPTFIKLHTDKDRQVTSLSLTTKALFILLDATA